MKMKYWSQMQYYYYIYSYCSLYAEKVERSLYFWSFLNSLSFKVKNCSISGPADSCSLNISFSENDNLPFTCRISSLETKLFALKHSVDYLSNLNVDMDSYWRDVCYSYYSDNEVKSELKRIDSSWQYQDKLIFKNVVLKTNYIIARKAAKRTKQHFQYLRRSYEI